MSRSASVTGSDRYSVVSGLTANYFSANPQDVKPAPAYVAPFGAKQVVTEHRAATRPPSSDNEDETTNKDDLQFSEPALVMINTFLDQLLFSFLSTARSTSLLALKPAVNDVLKSRLARDAIRSADEELHELLAGGDEDEENNAKQNGVEQRRKWDLELVWKRTRLRVMVYMRLGEMEDDDEERYVKEEELFHGNEKRFSQSSGLVSWAAAIFLTAVLEYIAEQTLQAAGNAAYARVRRQTLTGRSMTPEEKEVPVLVEEHDVDKCALNPTLGRLWRTWRKMSRNNAVSPHQRPVLSRLSNESFGRAPSVAGANEEMADGEMMRPMQLEDLPEMDYPEHVLASNIPLPMSDRRRDVDEIEVPGLAQDPEHNYPKDVGAAPVIRRNSFTILDSYRMDGGLPTPADSSSDMTNGERPSMLRRRSNSVPTPVRTPLAMDIPGAFPEEEEPAALLADGEKELDKAAPALDEQRRDEQKLDASAMSPHKRMSVGSKNLLDESFGDDASNETAAQHDKSEYHGLVEGVVAAVSGAATGAAALVLGNKVAHQEIGAVDGVDTRAVAEDPARPMASSDASSRSALEHAARPAASSDASSRSTRDTSFAGFENNKSLMDMKSLLATGAVSARRRGEHVGDPEERVRTSSDTSRSSYNLSNGIRLPQMSPAKRQNLNTTSSQETVSTTASSQQQARGSDGKPRPDRLFLSGTPQSIVDRAMNDSPTMRSNSPNFSRHVVENGLSGLPSQRYNNRRASQTSLYDQTRTTKQPYKRRSIPGIALSSASITPVSGSSHHRQSWSAALQAQREHQAGPRPLSVPAVPSVPFLHKSVPQESDTIQEHPVVQRMASLKRDQHKVDASAQPERSLTSASIRGPEDFDSFVQGVETVKYTLTPETVRELPVSTVTGHPEVEVLANTCDVQPQTSPVELSSAPSVSRRGPTDPDAATDRDVRTGRRSVSKQATSAIPSQRYTEEERLARERKRRSVSKPQPRNTSAHRRSGMTAREPRVQTASTQDFADFIRSTGPFKEQDVKLILNPASVSSTSLHSLRSAHINGAGSRPTSAVSQDRSRSMTRDKIQTENVPPVPSVPTISGKTSKSVLQARGASGGSPSNAELIDFIRNGPSQNGGPQISRSVAPFRNTMDSDQLQPQPMAEQVKTMSGRPRGLKLDTNVQPGQGVKSAGARGQRLTGLENNAAQTVHPAHSGQPQHLSSAATTPKSATNAMPPVEALPGSRRRVRNKDPYAIDMDDEDHDLLTALPKNKREEESLADFLNNNEPPKDNGPRPIVNGSSAQARSVLGKSRTGSMNSLRSAAANDAKTKSVYSTNNGPRPPSSNGVRPPSRNTLDPNRPRMEAKSPGDGTKERIGAFSREGNTRELAEFFKNSAPAGRQGPVPGTAVDDDGAPAPNINRNSKLNPRDAAKVQKKLEQDSLNATAGKKGGFFGRKKKSWLNMP
ncbi:hypothetical protein LTR62_008411 [Meristemomyces frigidus]|uniref:Uncharacterized protein n=1 Tax=Meristemomyces frigidus TaxID=1508187 RepID=A0AAN7TAX1_9PEZI|nr:hypothetical protein LTR62_008411 [Meristemomyces frigidus]